MKAILVKAPGGVENLSLGEWEKPMPQSNELLVKVQAAGINRADILQRKGKYPPPRGTSPLLGLEVAGVVEKVGEQVEKWKEGDEVMGLLPGGGYAEYIVIHEEMAIAKPDHFSMAEAAAVPEVFLTAFQAVKWLGRLKEKETILIHAGASGVGTACIQLAKALESQIIATASAGKHETCLNLGADHVIDYKSRSFKEEVDKITEGKGVDVIIDFIGAAYFQDNLDSMALDGRMVMLALLGGIKMDHLDLRKIVGRRLQITGSTLRSRSLDYQIKLNQELTHFAINLFHNGTLRPVVDKIFPWEQVAEAHQYMEANKNQGKIVLKI
ncbi:MAG: NAD(P)H-quinone oxidoreductase [Candidatus Cyclobacteriaceae bacterium M3_2C_046]